MLHAWMSIVTEYPSRAAVIIYSRVISRLCSISYNMEPITDSFLIKDCTVHFCIKLLNSVDQLMAYVASGHSQPNSFLQSMKMQWMSCWYWLYFSRKTWKVKICSVMLLSRWNPACSFGKTLIPVSGWLSASLCLFGWSNWKFCNSNTVGGWARFRP